MKKLYCFLITLCAAYTISKAQDYSYAAYPKHFELSLGGQHFFGDGGLMDFGGIRMGFRFNPDWSLKAVFASGIGNDWKNHRSDIADLGIARVVGNDGLKNLETQFTFGAGYLWDHYTEGVNGKVLGMMDIENRYYISPKGYLGATIKTYAGKDYVKASFLGITLGVRF